jgi:Ca-activated chloride channel family protein
MPVHFAHPAGLLLLLLIPLLALVWAYGDRRRRVALSRWTTNPASKPPLLKRALEFAAVAAIAVAVADPTTQPLGPPRAPRGSADIVFLLDVSRSMLATDITPNRLARAKAIIRDLADQDRGNRIALVAFAGGQSVECPLTVDHAFFGEALKDASPDSVRRGGTRIGDAIHFALDRVFDDMKRERRTLVVLSDGEDHDSQPDNAAADAERAKVHVVSIGVAELSGAVVPASATDPTPYRYRGEEVRSRLDAGVLTSIALGGAYLSGNERLDAAAIHQRWLAPAGQGTGPAESSSVVWAVLVALAILLLALEMRLPLRQTTATLLIVLLGLSPIHLNAQTVDEWFAKGLEALENQRFVDAMHYFGDAARWSPETAEIRFNLAKSLYGMRSYEESALSFEHAAHIAKEAHLKAQSYLGQGNALFRSATEHPSRADRAIPGLRSAIEAYRAALKTEPDLFAAKVNLSVAERRLREYLRRPEPESPPRPGMEPPPQKMPPANPDDILRESRRTQPPRALAQPGGVDKDW